MAKLNRPNGKLFGSSATNIGVFGSGQSGETPTTSTNPDAINTLGTHWEDGWNGAVVSQAPYTAPFVEDMNAVNYVNSYNGAYLLQAGIPEYSRTVDYYVDSVCTYNGAIYICVLDNPAVNASTDPNDPPGTLINFDPTDTTHWDERVELPTMNENEVLVGAVGGTGVATDTLNQGDIVASSGGLNIKSDVIVDADVKSDAAIAESKLALDHSTDSLNTAISGKAISNLADTTITTPVGDGDVLLFDDNSSKWVNSDSLSNHLNDTNNPHQTSMSNLDDANVNDRQTLADGDVMVYDLANTDWVNSPSLKNHLSDTNNPHTTTLANLDDTTITSPQDGDAIIYDYNNSKWINTSLPGGALSSLTDTTITSPTDKQLLQYDYANSKWVNSSDVWSRIEFNDMAQIRSTTGDFTVTSSMPHEQIITHDTPCTITVSDPNIKAGEKFRFRCLNLGANKTTPFYIKTANGETLINWYCPYYVIRDIVAKVDNPQSASDWSAIFQLRSMYHNGKETTFTNVGSTVQISSTLFSLPYWGYYLITVNWGRSKSPNSTGHFGIDINDQNNNIYYPVSGGKSVYVENLGQQASYISSDYTRMTNSYSIRIKSTSTQYGIKLVVNSASGTITNVDARVDAIMIGAQT